MINCHLASVFQKITCIIQQPFKSMFCGQPHCLKYNLSLNICVVLSMYGFHFLLHHCECLPGWHVQCLLVFFSVTWHGPLLLLMFLTTVTDCGVGWCMRVPPADAIRLISKHFKCAGLFNWDYVI